MVELVLIQRTQEAVDEQTGATAHPLGNAIAAVALDQPDLLGPPQTSQPAGGDQALVHGPQPSLEDREYRRPQGHRLAVHGPPRRYHQVRVGDQRLGVDGLLGDDEASGSSAARSAARRSAAGPRSAR